MLRNYRATPHNTTGTSPSSLLFGREIHVKLPEPPTKDNISENTKQAVIRDAAQKTKMKDYADRRHSSNREINIGDYVLVKQPKTN